VLQGVADCCRVLQGVADCFFVLHSAAVNIILWRFFRLAALSFLEALDCPGVLQGVADCCSVLQSAAVCCSVFQFVCVCVCVFYLQCIPLCSCNKLVAVDCGACLGGPLCVCV